MTLKYVAEIRDPIHGYIKITKEERELIDSIFVQRLRRIHQLAGAYLVYPGGVHSRFEHVIGTMHVAGLIGQSVADKAGLHDDDIQELRIAALLHDVGHGPFSHLFEEVLAEKTDLTHEDLSQRIVSESNIGDILKRNGYQPSKISKLCVGKSSGQPFMNQVIAGGLSADMMDYLLRDTYFTGVEYGKVDIQRVIDSLDVSADGHLMLERAALYAFEALLIARYEMFKAVYFHRTVRAAELMLAHSMTLADNELHLTDLSKIDKILRLTDEVVLQQLADLDPSHVRAEDGAEARGELHAEEAGQVRLREGHAEEGQDHPADIQQEEIQGRARHGHRAERGREALRHLHRRAEHAVRALHIRKADLQLDHPLLQRRLRRQEEDGDRPDKRAPSGRVHHRLHGHTENLHASPSRGARSWTRSRRSSARRTSCPESRSETRHLP